MIQHIKFFFIGLLMMFAISYGKAETKSNLQLIKRESAIVIDGVLEDSWLNGAHFKDFVEFIPNQNIPAKTSTEGYILYDSSALYIAFICHDPEIAKLRASMTDRDKIYQDDFVGVILGTNQDQQKAFEFFCNPQGIQGDMIWQASVQNSGDEAIWQANGSEDKSFDAIWSAESKIHDDKWVVETKIPFACLRFPNQTEQEWLIHLVRNYPRDNSYQFSWMPISRNNNSFMGQAGNILFSLNSNENGKQALEILPYYAGSKEDHIAYDSEKDQGKWDNGSVKNRFGFSLKYSITSNNIVDFTYRPDFSQIESDAGQISVNNPFAFFYQERRPFFVEGLDIFQIDRGINGFGIDVPANLIYTRSIGDPIAAGKLTGKNGKLTYGFLSAYDESTPMILPFADGTVVLSTKEKSWSNILRTKYDLSGESSLGITATDRRFDKGGANSVGCIDATLRLSERYRINILGAATHTDEPDDSVLSQRIINQYGNYKFKSGNDSITAIFDNENFTGAIFKTRLFRQSAGWNYTLGYQDYSPGVRANNSSIFSNDGRALEFLTFYRFRFENHPIFVYIEPQALSWYKRDYAGDIKDRGARGRINLQLQKQTFISICGFIYNREKFAGIQFGNAQNIWMYINSNFNKNIYMEGFVLYGNTINRLGELTSVENPLEIVPNLQFNTSLIIRPFDKIQNEINYSSEYLWKNDGEQIVKQQIVRNTVAYQFSKKIYLRLIGELVFTDRYNYSNTYFNFETLLNYKLNPFTVFYLGGSFNGSEDPYPNYKGLTRTQQTIFLKFQYLWNVI